MPPLSTVTTVVGYATSVDINFIAQWILWHMVHGIEHIVVLDDDSGFNRTSFLSGLIALHSSMSPSEKKDWLGAFVTYFSNNNEYNDGQTYNGGRVLYFLDMSSVNTYATDYYSRRIDCFNHAWSLPAICPNSTSNPLYFSFIDVRDFWFNEMSSNFTLGASTSVFTNGVTEVRCAHQIYYISNLANVTETNSFMTNPFNYAVQKNNTQRVTRKYELLDNWDTNSSSNPPASLAWPFKSFFKINSVKSEVTKIYVHKVHITNNAYFNDNDESHKSDVNPHDDQEFYKLKRIMFPISNADAVIDFPDISGFSVKNDNPKFAAQVANYESTQHITLLRYTDILNGTPLTFSTDYTGLTAVTTLLYSLSPH